jgi:hypothetical protein
MRVRGRSSVWARNPCLSCCAPCPARGSRPFGLGQARNFSPSAQGRPHRTPPNHRGALRARFTSPPFPRTRSRFRPYRASIAHKVKSSLPASPDRSAPLVGAARAARGTPRRRRSAPRATLAPPSPPGGQGVGLRTRSRLLDPRACRRQTPTPTLPAPRSPPSRGCPRSGHNPGTPPATPTALEANGRARVSAPWTLAVRTVPSSRLSALGKPQPRGATGLARVSALWTLAVRTVPSSRLSALATPQPRHATGAARVSAPRSRRRADAATPHGNPNPNPLTPCDAALRAAPQGPGANPRGCRRKQPQQNSAPV